MTFDENRLKDPGYYRENRLDPHTDHCWYLSDAEREGSFPLKNSEMPSSETAKSKNQCPALMRIIPDNPVIPVFFFNEKTSDNK